MRGLTVQPALRDEAERFTNVLTARRVLALLGYALLVTLAIIYVRAGFQTVEATTQAAAGRGNALVPYIDDIAMRDLPKARAMLLGHWYDDPHYIGEVHWYPFATPLLVTLYARAANVDLSMAYLYVPVLCAAATLLAIGGLLYRHYGLLGLPALPIAIVLGLFWPYNGNNPIHTVTAPLTLFVLVAGTVAVRVWEAGARQSGALFALGLLNGLLGCWQGSSFWIALLISASLLLLAAARHWREWRALAGPGAAYVAGLGLAISPLLGPQLLAYGQIRYPALAGSYLAPHYLGGSQPASFFSLVEGPRGADLLLLGLFLLLTLFEPRAELRLRKAPLALAYAVALIVSHMGYVVDAKDYPALARIANTLLVVPAHTFYDLSLFLLSLIKLLTIGALVYWGLRGARKLAGARGQIWQALGAGALLTAAYALALGRMPAQTLPRLREIDAATVAFMQQVSHIAGNDAAVQVEYEWGQWSTFAFAPFKVPYLVFLFHRNPYVEDERLRLDQQLNFIGDDPAQTFGLLRRYHVQYVLTMPGQRSALVQLCDGSLLLSSPQGHQLYRLGASCRAPAMQPEAELPLKDRLGLLTTNATPLYVTGLKPAKEHFLAYGRVPVAPGDGLTELHLQGNVRGSAAGCIKPQVTFWNGKRQIGVHVASHAVAGAFDVRMWFVPATDATEIQIQVAFEAECFAQGQQVTITRAALAHAAP